jgi:hypothetical protein
MTEGDQARYSHLGLNLPANSSNARPTVPAITASSSAAPTQSAATPQTQGTRTAGNGSSSSTHTTQRATVHAAPASIPRQTTEQTRIAQLEAELATLRAARQPVEAGNIHNAELPREPQTEQARPLLHLFEDDATLARIKEALVIKDENGKKPLLPDIIPGFKANPLDIGKHVFLFYFILFRSSPA